MNTNTDITIRLEKESDRPATENLVRESFWNVYRPGCLEHYVLHCLREQEDFMDDLCFVMEKNGVMIGQNLFVNAQLKGDDGSVLPIMTMGPISIHPDYKRKGFGKILLDYTLEKAREKGCGAVCFEGNHAFYSKCGFTYASEYGIRYHGLPEGEDSSFFLCRELIPGYLDGFRGEYATPEVYFVDEKKAEDFDRGFLPKEKLILPGQLF